MDHQVMFDANGSTRVVVHLELPGGALACLPGMKGLEATPTRTWPYQRSDDPRAVSCRLCRETDAYKERLTEIRSSLGVVVA